MTQIILTKGQRIALVYHLTEYPSDVAFEDILEMMEDDSNSVTIWCMFEKISISTLCSYIRSLARTIDRAIADSRESNG